MVADSNSKELEKARKALEKGGFKVVEARNGLECLQKLHKGLKPSLIILDAGMPVMSGWRTLYELHKDKQFAKIKAVLFKDKEGAPFPEPKNLPSYEKYARELEAHYIPKPFTPEEIVRRVKKLMAG